MEKNTTNKGTAFFPKLLHTKSTKAPPKILADKNQKMPPTPKSKNANICDKNEA